MSKKWIVLISMVLIFIKKDLFSQFPQEIELNDTPTDAGVIELPSGTTYMAFINSEHDVDYWKVEVPDSGSLYITLRTTDPAMTNLPADYRLELYDADYILRDLSDNSLTQFERINFILTGRPGVYFIKVSSSPGLPTPQFSSITAYAICATYPPITTIPKATIITPVNGGIVATKGRTCIEASLTGSPSLVEFYMREYGTPSFIKIGEDKTFSWNRATFLDTRVLLNNTY